MSQVPNRDFQWFVRRDDNFFMLWAVLQARAVRDISRKSVLIASMNKSLCCLFVPCVTSTNQTSGCIVTRRIISSVAVDIIINNSASSFNRSDFRKVSTSASISSGLFNNTLLCSFEWRPLLWYDNNPSPVYVLSRNSYTPSYSHITRKNYKERVREMQVSNGE